jgi:GNAT superfamily N-acetyltransferase
VVFVEKMQRSRSDFYALMGPYFGSRAVAKEVGIHLYDDADKVWFGAFDGELIGFASVRKGVVSDCYVAPHRRNQGVFKTILSSVLLLTEKNLKATCTHASRKAFANAGFSEVKRTSNFTWMELNRA